MLQSARVFLSQTETNALLGTGSMFATLPRTRDRHLSTNLLPLLSFDAA